MVRQLAASLVRSGVETHIATTDDNGPLRMPVRCGEPVVEDGVIYWYFPRQLRFYTFSWPLNRWLWRHAGDYDLVHIHALFSFAELPASYWARRRGVPYIVRPLGTLNHWGMTHRRPWLKKASFQILERRVLSHAALVHYTSGQERREAEALHVAGPSATIPNALPEAPGESIPGAFRREYPQLRGRRIVLFLSRLDPKKGISLLLRSFAALRAEATDTSLVIAGDGDSRYVAQLRAEAGSLGIADHVVWPGFLAGEGKQAAFADADFYVLPSFSENFGIAVAEAMAAGLPVVVSDQVGIHEEVAAARAGLVVRCDAGELAHAMRRLTHDADLRRTLGRNARRLAVTRYSQEAITRQVLDVYNTISSLESGGPIACEERSA